MKKIEVLIVDDSAVVRQALSQILAGDPQFEVIAAVADPVFAMARMRIRWPEVIVLDIEMPRMDGLSFLRKLMAERPTPVVICSSLTERGSETALEAMAAGAVAVVEKPKIGLRDFFNESAADLLATVKAAAHVNMSRLQRLIPAAQAVAAPAVGAQSDVAASVSPNVDVPPPKLCADVILAPPPAAAAPLQVTTERVVAIGTSTGGTQALEHVLTALPPGGPGIVVVQHMPEKFTAAFAHRLDGLSAITVREARDGERLLPGHALIAPGGRHLMLRRSGAYYYAEVVDGPPVNRHKPSVDVLFRSVARAAGRNALGIIMTGMGDDGARGLRELRDAGAQTIAQDEASCVVFGMPKEAIRLGGAQQVLALQELPRAMTRFSIAAGA